jgi:hypothetical protein
MPDECFLPILSKAKHIQVAEVNVEHWQKLKQQNDRVWLFYPAEAHTNNDEVQAYLSLPKDKGGCNRNAYYVSKRATWYQVRLPAIAHGFMSGMVLAHPFISMNLMPNLNASNTLYTVHFRSYINEVERYGWALSMLSSYTQQGILQYMRRYADGLTKYEPKDLMQIELVKPRTFDYAREIYQEAIALHLKGDCATARMLADRFL